MNSVIYTQVLAMKSTTLNFRLPFRSGAIDSLAPNSGVVRSEWRCCATNHQQQMGISFLNQEKLRFNLAFEPIDSL